MADTDNREWTEEQKEEFRHELEGFIGSAHVYRYHTLFLTEGVIYLADKARCYWLVDMVWSIQHLLRKHQFVVITFHRDEEGGHFTAYGDPEASSGDVMQVYYQHVPLTDFPLDRITLYFSGTTLLLPSES